MVKCFSNTIQTLQNHRFHVAPHEGRGHLVPDNKARGGCDRQTDPNVLSLSLSLQQALTQSEWGALMLFWYHREYESNTFASSQTALEIPWAVPVCVCKMLVLLLLMYELERKDWLSLCLLSPENKGRDYCAFAEGRRSKLFWSLTGGAADWAGFKISLEKHNTVFLLYSNHSSSKIPYQQFVCLLLRELMIKLMELLEDPFRWQRWPA